MFYSVEECAIPKGFLGKPGHAEGSCVRGTLISPQENYSNEGKDSKDGCQNEFAAQMVSQFSTQDNNKLV
jgi:hypothetical protein